jgi:hypothetical protein
LEKGRSIRNTNLLLRIEQKFKDCTIQQSAACKENKTLLAFNEAPQALGGTTYYTILLGFILFMNRKIIDLFADGNIRIVLFCLDSTLASRLAYNYNILLFNPAHYFFIFGLQK